MGDMLQDELKSLLDDRALRDAQEKLARAVGLSQQDAVGARQKEAQKNPGAFKNNDPGGLPPYYDFPAIDLPPGTQFKPMPTNHYVQYVGESAVAFAVLDPRGEDVFVTVHLHRAHNRLGYDWVLTMPNGKSVTVSFNRDGDELSQQIDHLICQMRRDANMRRAK